MASPPASFKTISRAACQRDLMLLAVGASARYGRPQVKLKDVAALLIAGGVQGDVIKRSDRVSRGMWAGLLQDTRLRGVLLVFAPRPGVRWELCRCGRGSAFYVVWEACDLVVGATVNTYAENMTSHPTPATPSDMTGGVMAIRCMAAKKLR